MNVGNAAVAFLLVLAWCFSRTGERGLWMRLRLFSSVSLLAGLFMVIAVAIFTTYFDQLVVLERDKGFFVTDNASMYRMASKVGYKLRAPEKARSHCYEFTF